MARTMGSSGGSDETSQRAVQYLAAMLFATIVLSCMIWLGWIPRLESCSDGGYSARAAIQDMRSVLSFTAGVLLCQAAQSASRGHVPASEERGGESLKGSAMCLLW